MIPKVMCKLRVKDVKEMINLKPYNAEVFKSGMFVKLWCKDADKEDALIDKLHSMDFSCIPDMIPSNGFYTLQLFKQEIK